MTKKNISIFVAALFALVYLAFSPTTHNLFYRAVLPIGTPKIQLWAAKKLLKTPEGAVIVLRSDDVQLTKAGLDQFYGRYLDERIPEELFDELVRISATGSFHRTSATIFRIFVSRNDKYHKLNVMEAEKSLLKALRHYKGADLLMTINLISATMYHSCNTETFSPEIKKEINKILKETDNEDVKIGAQDALEIIQMVEEERALAKSFK